MAAMSLMLTAADFHPSDPMSVVARSKCTPRSACPSWQGAPTRENKKRRSIVPDADRRLNVFSRMTCDPFDQAELASSSSFMKTCLEKTVGRSQTAPTLLSVS